MTVVSEFSQLFENHIIGTITGTFDPSQFPDVPCNLMRLRARSGNVGSIFITHIPNGLFGWEMSAGDDTGWVPADNLNNLWCNRSSGSSYLDYWAQR